MIELNSKCNCVQEEKRSAYYSEQRAVYAPAEYTGSSVLISH